jgi:short-subunit dehydrogenase
VITGGSSGIGAALARKLAGRGWQCVLLARGLERLRQVAAELEGEAETCDVSDREAVEGAAARVGERHPAVHLLVLAAGIPGRKGFLELEPERIEEVLRINYLGSVWSLLAFLPLLDAGAPSDVVTVASVAGTVAVPTSGPYSASKHAQLAFARSVAAELAPRGIRMHAINPGPVPTPGFPQDRLEDKAWSRLVLRSPEQVADAVVRAVERGRPEVAVPRGLRVVAAAQALFPGTLARVTAKRAQRP